jgi:hypothetical protein
LDLEKWVHFHPVLREVLAVIDPTSGGQSAFIRTDYRLNVITIGSER